jgi:hypothetical protein
MIEFVEECRREWRRLGVPDPIANEMALDLTVDIEEAEADGGSAEDVLGNSLFDPRRFAAAWANARGVATPAPPGPTTPLLRVQHWYRPALLVSLSVVGFLMLLLATALLVGRRGVAVAATVSQRVVLPRSPRWFGPVHPFQSSFPSQGFGVFAVVVLLVLFVGIVAIGLTLILRTSGSNGNLSRRFW